LPYVLFEWNEAAAFASHGAKLVSRIIEPATEVGDDAVLADRNAGLIGVVLGIVLRDAITLDRISNISV
jgi:hypothetical protein